MDDNEIRKEEKLHTTSQVNVLKEPVIAVPQKPINRLLYKICENY